jgi:hypothetical protein
MPQSKSAQNARIGALWTLIDVEHVRKQIGGSACVLFDHPHHSA